MKRFVCNLVRNILLAVLTATIFSWSMANSSAQEQLLKKDDPSGFTPHQIEFFENKVRPLLVEHCLQCHGADAKKIRGGLRMSSRAEILLGGDSGPAAVVGKPDDSLMISSIHYQDYEMPPKGKLKDAEIEILTEWVKMGLPDPREPGDVMKPDTIDIEKGKLFWAFKKTQQATPPPTRNDAWPESPIDQFVLSRLESESLAPVTDANREVLIRRAHLALTGLPPTIEQIDRFESDERETKLAFENVVDELLASKHFGERWGRHWLDVARFAESSGGGRSLMFPHAWRFRDYVIDAYNNDKPFDEFIKEQIAGDLLPFDSHAQKTERIVATGLLALGPTNYEQQDKELLRMEVIDEQVDTIGRAFLGLTLGCARCHDHKFDPIPMTDYYAMAGIFGSTRSLVDGNVSKYVERPLATDAELAAEKKYGDRVAALSKKLTAAKKELSGLTGKNETDISDPKKNRLSKNFEGIVLDDRTAKLTGYWKESTSIGLFIDGHYLHDNNGGKDKKLAVFTPKFESGGQYEVRLAYTAGGNRASNVPVTVDHQDGKSTILVNQSQTPPIDGIFISLGTFRFEADNKSSVTISTTDTDGHVIVDAVQFLKKDKSAQPEIQSNQTAENNSTTDTATSDTQQVAKPDGTELKIDAKKANRIAKLNKEIQSLNQRLKQLKKSPPKRLDVAMTVTDTKNPSDGHLHIRGSVRNLGPIIPRGFVTVCCDESPQAKLDLNESGRLQLAEWIASPDHPLTARVYVNRVWRHLFGSGLVSTTDNFGAMGQRPTHPELLDHLAYEFVSNGWSTKKLIRKIMSSHVYRLSTNDNDQARKKDNRNRLLWKSNRRRVDAEVLRDSILFISGDLDLTPGGLTIQKITQYDFDYKFNTSRRSVYVPTFRNSMLGLFEVFDFANPNLVIGDRNTSTLPTQALFLMNNPMIIKQSKKAAKRLLARENLESKSRVEYAYRQSFGRRPTKHEVDDSLAYIESFVAASDSKNAQVEAWSSFCHALFASLEFRYVE